MFNIRMNPVRATGAARFQITALMRHLSYRKLIPRDNHTNVNAASIPKCRVYILLPLILMFIFLTCFTVDAQDLTCSNLPKLMEAFQAKHYAIRSTTPEIRMHAVDQMIKRLDPSKTLLYASDLEKLKELLMDLFVSAEKSNCTSLTPVYDLLVARARENEAIVKKILGPDFRLDLKAALNINVEKRPYPKTTTEKQELLKKIIQFQIENTLIAGVDLAEAKTKQIHRYELQTRRVVEQDPAQLITASAEAFAQALDPHTDYLSPKNLEDLQIHMKLSLEGIGALLSSDAGFTVIEELVPGGSAEKTGLLKPKDKIIAVAQEGEMPVDVIDLDLRDVISMIRGKKGTRVTLTILRQAKLKECFDVTIVRDKIDVKDREAKITYESRQGKGRTYRFGIIDLPSFYGGEKGGKSSYEDVKRLLAEAKLKKVDGIVLDLSRNGGGLLEEAVRLTGLFVGEGGIVAVKDNKGMVKILANGSAEPGKEYNKNNIMAAPEEDTEALYMGPLVVLTSRLSASASEIVAGALQDYHRALIIGSDHTYGKGSVQAILPLPFELGAMKVTTGLYFLPGGKSTQKTGVAADVRLPGWFVLEDIGEAALDYPLPSQAIAPFVDVREKDAPRWNLIDAPMITKISAKSRSRVAKDAKFAKIIKDNKEAADKKDIIQLDDFRKAIKKEGGDFEKKTLPERRQKAKEQYAPFVNESINILLDVVTLRPTVPG